MPQTPSFDFVTDLPTGPGLYVLYGGTGRGRHVAYVGISSSSLRGRLRQHFLRQDSSIVTGTSAVSLDPGLVTRVAWWKGARFEEKVALQAAEQIAFEVFDPALRSRSRTSEAAAEKARDEVFAASIRSMLQEGPTGQVDVPTLSEALQRIEAMEGQVQNLRERVAELEVMVRELQKP